MLARSVGGGWEARWQWLQCFFFFRVKTSAPASSPSLFFLFLLSVLSSLSLCFSSLLSLFLCFFLFLPYFPSFPFGLLQLPPSPLCLFFLFFFLSVFRPLSFSASPLLLSSLAFIGKNRGERGRGSHCAAAPKTARRARPLWFFHTVVGHGSEIRQVGALGRRLFEFFWRKGERKAGEKYPSSSPASRVQWKKKTQSAVQNDTVLVLFFNN